MEVHHHPHVEKKNLKEYILAFLMIFLARDEFKPAETDPR
jgi:hypothetical protein